MLTVTDLWRPWVAMSKATDWKLTIDSSEPLTDAMRVLGAVYGVTLTVSSDGPDASGDEQNAGKPTENRRTARRRPSATTRKARAAAPATGAGESKQEAAPRSAGSLSNAEVSSWARQNGMTVNDRGRVPALVMTAFRNAHNVSPDSVASSRL